MSEIIRRLKTTSQGVGREVTEGILIDMMDDLTAMGYSEEWKEKVLKASMAGHMRVLRKVREGSTCLHRKGKDTLVSRRFKRLVGSSEWFRVQEEDDATEVLEPWDRKGCRNTRRVRTGDSRYIESIFFVPHTPNSQLKRNLQKMEEKLPFRTRWRYVEQMGRSLRETLIRKDPDQRHCGRRTCLPCQSKPGNCMRQGAVYAIWCNTCRGGGRQSV